MKGFINAIKEINRSLNGMLLFIIFINTFLVFLTTYLIFLILGFNPFYSFAPAFIYLVFISYVKLKENKMFKVEAIYPELNEKLRTAADNFFREDNPVVDDLEREVVEELKHVETASFLNTKKISLKIMASIVLCFIIFFMTSFEIKPLQIESLIANIPGSPFGWNENKTQETLFAGGPMGAGNITGSGELFGIESPIQFGKREEKIAVQTTGYEFNVRDIKDAEKKEFEEQFPEEIFVQGASAYSENIPKEQQELVKNYFKKLAEG